MTIRETVQMAADERRIHLRSLDVVPVRGQRRAMSLEPTDLQWVPPSPNMPTCGTARVDPGGCLLEGTNLIEGRGNQPVVRDLRRPVAG